MAPTHGKNSTYTNYGCRCDLCRTAARKYAKERRRKQLSGDFPGVRRYPSNDPNNPRVRYAPDLPSTGPRDHGSVESYANGCKCPACKEGQRARLHADGYDVLEVDGTTSPGNQPREPYGRPTADLDDLL